LIVYDGCVLCFFLKKGRFPGPYCTPLGNLQTVKILVTVWIVSVRFRGKEENVSLQV